MYEHLRSVIKKLHPVQSGYDMIRIGYPHDGGYLIPNALEGIRYAFSPGVSGMIEVEDQLVDKGMECFLLDGSVDAPPFKHPESIHFEKMNLTRSDSATSFSIDTWKQRSIGDYKGDLFLQMDIEGFEFEVLDSASEETLKQFRIMVVEFHEMHICVNGTWLSMFDKLCEHFHVVHIHPNNFKIQNTFVEDLVIPNTMEITFMNKSALPENPLPADTFPHPLDTKNDPNQDRYDLPECWYR